MISRKWVSAGISVALIAMLAGFVARNLVLGTPVPVYVATRGALVQTVVASGRVMTPQRVSVASEATGRVVSIPVDEGQTVRRGQVLIELDQSDERAAVAQAQAGIAQADAKLRQLTAFVLPAAEQAELQAEANVRQARQQYDRTKDLVARSFVAQSQLDDAQRNLDVALSQLRAAQLQVATNRPDGSDYAVAKAALAQAKASLQVAEAKLDATLIRAPVGGILIARNVEPGNVAEAGKELMALAPVGETQLVLQIDEKHLAEIAVGQKALGSADAFPAQRFAAELEYINPGVDPNRGAVEVKLRVIEPPPYLRQDMTVSVDIEVARRADAIIVPSDALHDADAAEPWALVVRDRHTVRQPVRLGVRGDERTEVLEGIAPGDALVPVTSVTIEAGRHVRGVAIVRNASG